jgi:hypothetical protein
MQDMDIDTYKTYFINAFTEAYDPHSSYLSPEKKEDFDIDMGLSLQGIGATLSIEDGMPKVVDIIPGSPAERDMSENHLIPGDKIIAVAQGDEEFVDQKRVSFRRLIDGTRVIGNDICDLYFNSTGLSGVELTFYNYEKTGELDMLTLDDAIDKIKNPDVFGFKSETNKNFSGKTDKLTIDRTKLLFVNQYSNGCEILQPVYNLMGTAENEGGSIEFSARIIAIPEKYTYVAEKDYEQ